MYKRSNKINSDSTEVSNYVDGIDIFNSTLLRTLNDPNISRVDYLITNYQFRPDLIANDFYGSDSYEGLLMLQNPIPISKYRKGLILKLIPKSELDSIIDSLV